VNGRPWRNPSGKAKITDRDMVELATLLHGWTRSVYAFGCAFIHLSNFHDYEDRNPLVALDPVEVDAIKHYLSYYHGAFFDHGITLTDIAPCFPMVFQKISGNLNHYLEKLESGSTISVADI
jgi:hypothetical protein